MITKEQAKKMLKEIDPVTDAMGVRFRALFLISIGYCAGEAYAQALEWSGVKS